MIKNTKSISNADTIDEVSHPFINVRLGSSLFQGWGPRI
jgi:hypothetical protein